MVKTTITWKRQNTDTEWWSSIITSTYKKYVKDKYQTTNKRLNSKLLLSKDGLVLTSETIFSSIEAFEEFSSDPIIRSWVNTRKDYCIKNNIEESDRVIQQY